MRCQFCGFDNAPEARFCQQCGANLATDADPGPIPEGVSAQGAQLQSFPPRVGAYGPLMVTTGLGFEGYRITRHLGLVRGLTVRSRSALGNLAGQVQSLFGGNLSVYVDLCETARDEAYQRLIQHAIQIGANAVIAMRYDANDIMDGITEVLAYGTAVVVEPSSQPS